MSEEGVDPAEVRHVASLARIELDDDEVERFASQFEEILDAFETLDAVPDVDRESDLHTVLRPDESQSTLTREQVFENAPDREDDRFKGPNVS
ncbi:Asp-tRNA(Asn)/Glu-tRNA(Gln) amidotransferase subunit GatC [Halovivax limisalsi]|uniref:Asp-tRNA(Asn)/Glu-tRNA(Gln) amidotransferase subunit GatC n=1 Tax=Halovivax limisalsi TaxID=1453760 RepID=UPI001FFCC10E|nr:Asp-tRNA(Asn)/Glu-tRNA(Gln) amidotransferase subunit GatC [Halovivax limisalsi]